MNVKIKVRVPSSPPLRSARSGNSDAFTVGKLWDDSNRGITRAYHEKSFEQDTHDQTLITE